MNEEIKIHNYDSTLEELKPCPFCGGIPTAHLIGNEYTKKIIMVVNCKPCNINMRVGAFRGNMLWLQNTIIKKWNTRSDYKLGAKDAIEAIDSGLIDGLRERTVKNNIFPSYSEAQVVAFKKAQQFIDSLEGCHHSSLGSASTLVGGRCKVCGKTTKEMDDLINGY